MKTGLLIVCIALSVQHGACQRSGKSEATQGNRFMAGPSFTGEAIRTLNTLGQASSQDYKHMLDARTGRWGHFDQVMAAELGEDIDDADEDFNESNNEDARPNLLAATLPGLSEECMADYNLTLEAYNLSVPWAVAMYDSMGRMPSFLLGGNYKWMGAIDECEMVKAMVGDVEQFHGKYCKTTLGLKSLPAIYKAAGGSSAQFGVCASHRCNDSEVKILLKQAFDELKPDIDFRVNSVMCHGPRELTEDAIVVICILSFLGALVVVGTVYDVIFVQLKLTEPRGYETLIDASKYETSAETHLDGKTAKVADEKTPLIIESGSLKNGSFPPPKEEKKQGLLAKILMSFSAYTNGCKILSTAQGSETLGAINGIRFLSMGWVILGHSYGTARGFAVNQVARLPQLYDRFTFSAVAYATVSVDSFFVLSGLLVSYLAMKELKKVGGAKRFNWLMFYFHRFWRLTPPYMLVLMVGAVLMPYWSQGAFGISPELDVHPRYKWCKDNWWVNLLYVNNYVNTKEKCMGHAWYLANDMQFYVISPLIIIPLFYNIIIGGIVCAVFLVATVTANLVIVSENEYPVQGGPGVPPPKDKDYFDNIYAASYARIGPYIVGLMTGYLLYRMKCKCKIPLALNLFLWCVCIATCCLCVYGPFTDGGDNIFSNFESTIYFGFARTGWGVAVAWIIFACATGNGGWINQLLSWRAFIPLGRLSYLAYLIHPFIQVLYFENLANPVYMSNIDMIYQFCGHMCITYGFSFLLSLVFEAPMMGLEKALLRKSK